MSRIPEPVEGNVPEPAPRGVRALFVRLQGQLRWIKGFSRLPDVEGEGGELAGEGDAGQFLAHAASEELEIEVLEGTGTAGGGCGGPLEDALERAVVMTIEATGHGTATAACRVAGDEGEVGAGVGDDGEAAVAPEITLGAKAPGGAQGGQEERDADRAEEGDGVEQRPGGITAGLGDHGLLDLGAGLAGDTEPGA